MTNAVTKPLAVLLVLVVVNSVAMADPPPKKWAFLVGVSKYDKAGLNALDYPESDVTKIGDVLKGAGFEVDTMLGAGAGTQRATASNLKTELLEKFATTRVQQLNRQDVLLIVLSGHGLQVSVNKNGKAVEDSFFCPVDAIKSNPDTMLSISDLMQRVSANSGAENNLLVIDACRDNPSKGAKSLDGSLVTALPVNMAVLFGSSSGTRSYESQKLQSGLLGHYFLEGFKGAARDQDGEVTWGTLVTYVKKHVSRNSQELVGQSQRPNDISNLQGEPPILVKITPPVVSPPVVAPPVVSPPMVSPPVPTTSFASKSPSDNFSFDDIRKRYPELFKPAGSSIPPLGTNPNFVPRSRIGKNAGELRDDNQLGMNLIWCPAPFSNVFNFAEHESGFWMGKYEVTQGEWTKIMGTTPWKDQLSARDGTNFPATYVSNFDASEFCKKLTASERAAGRLAENEEYKLPSEAQWELACRAGTSTEYSFGSNADDLSQYEWYGANAGDTNESYAHQVGLKKPNPWGFHDMQGNVCEWTSESKPDANPLSRFNPEPLAYFPTYMVYRGGSWLGHSDYCKIATKGDKEAITRDRYLGFRVLRIVNK